MNPDKDFLDSLLQGLRKNKERFGYASCPCRLASGVFELDRDIICPCDYRDPDVDQFGGCYCALYVRKDVFEGLTPIASIPERRPTQKQMNAYEKTSESSDELSPVTESLESTMRLWFCKQCGYVCFREEPPYVCPICKAKREMFSELVLNVESEERD